MEQRLHSPSELQDPTRLPTLWYRIHVFVYDLRHFREKDDSQARLDQIVDASYLGTPYFSAEEVRSIKDTVVKGEADDDDAPTTTTTTLEQLIEQTLEERLNRRNKKRVDSGDYRVCAAHDLAPVLEKAFRIDPKALARDQGFLKLVDSRGLRLSPEEEESWTGLSKEACRPKGQGPKKTKKKGKAKKGG
ncbi:MAG: hypothetical protein M1837_003394 [Sclerophora amabilis]|nr:MAG: hypothetical protein M1837_003394 [Sclerophora amabilis]